MNLYLRLIWAILRGLRLPSITVGDSLQRTLRVLPSDLDVNGHMNNGRYLTLVDLMLVEYFARTGFAKVLLKNGWRPMSGGSFITYRQGLKPFQSYQLRFRLDASDLAWNYMRFEFERDGVVCAAGYMKGAAVGRGGLVPNSQSYAALGLPAPSALVPAPVQNWLAAEASVITLPW